LKMRDVGRKTKYTHDEIGYTLRLNSINAAIGKVQLRYLDKWNEKRRSLARIYDDNLRGIGDLVIPPQSEHNSESVYHMYVIKTDKRNALGAWLSANGIGTGVHYPIPVHRQPAYDGYAHETNLPLTDNWSETVLSIPIHPKLNYKDQQFVIKMIKKFYEDRLYDSDSIKNEAKTWSMKLI
jgi:perosamine synthetase